MALLNILVVDDEIGIRSGIKRILNNYTVGYPFLEEDFSFNLSETDNGIKALEIILTDKPDLVLLDNKLPGMNGIDVLEILKNKQVDIPVMMITSYASLDLAVKATKNGAYNFVPKPFTPQELKAAIDNITKHLFLKRMTQKLLNEEKVFQFQFLSVLSHELKSPINAIEEYLKVMQYKQAGSDIESYETMIDRCVVRLNDMRKLIHDLLDLTKVETGKKHREIRKTDIIQIAKKSIETIKPLAKNKNISININPPENIYLNADMNEIEIIFNNLISNAVKYNIKNGEVNIDFKENNQGLLIIVEDKGIGMTQKEISKLFQEFVRIKNIKTKDISGSGLGLTIIKRIVDLYNGNIEIESKEGEGTKFMVFLPKS